MADHPSFRIADCFVDLVDPRIARTRRHNLLDIVSIALCAMICGAESILEIVEWGTIKEAWLRTWLELPNGIPSHDTVGRVFSLIDPRQFEAGFARWVREVVAMLPPVEGGVIAIDGKTVCGAHEHNGNPLHLVSAFAVRYRLVLGQEAVDVKSNEITAIPILLSRLDLNKQIVTIDAMGCQRAIAAQIVDQGGDYVLALKANHPELHAGVAMSFAEAKPAESRHYKTTDKGHGRIEIRTCKVITDPEVIAWLNPEGAWAGLTSIAEVVGERKIDGVVTKHTRYYLSSLPGSASEIAKAVRSHWGIENGVHWVLDVQFQEDTSRSRIGHSAENLALLRKIVVNMIRNEPTRKIGIRASRKKAGWDDSYLLRVLRQF